MTLSRFFAICSLRDCRAAAARRSSVLSANVDSNRSTSLLPQDGQATTSAPRTSRSNSPPQLRQ